MTVSDSYDKWQCWYNYVMITSGAASWPGRGVNPVCSTRFLPPPLLPPGLSFSCLPEYRMSVWKDAIWPTSCSLSRVSMATLSSEWGHGSNWPIVSKLHFSEWFPQSCYWNRAPAPLMDTSCHSQFKRQEGKVQTWHPGVLGWVGGSLLSLLKQRNYQILKKKKKTAEL